MDRLSPQILADFASLLERRFSRKVFTTEDSIRYTFYAALLRNGLSPDNVVVEYRHPGIKGAQVDTVILGEDDVPTMAIEFKYNREIPSGRNMPLPQAAGSLFHDLSRLISFDNVANRYFIYVTDQNMARYLGSPKRGLQRFFHLAAGSILTLGEATFASCPPTFHSQMGEWPVQCQLQCLTSTSCANGHFLRIYQIERLVSDPMNEKAP